MKNIVKITFGSHLYGTYTEQSDLDIKAIYLPTAKDILLQKVKPVIIQSRNKEKGEKNTPADIDFEAYSPEKFLTLVADGYLVALEMYFAPDEYIVTKPNPLWDNIKKVAYKLLNKNADLFIRYCKQQALKHGNKSERMIVAQQILNILIKAENYHGKTQKVRIIEPKLIDLQNENQLCIGEITYKNTKTARYFEICGKKILLDLSLKSAIKIAQNIIDENSHASKNIHNNINWKAMHHAVRVGREAIEYLSTQSITFPRPDADYLRAIKYGEISFEQVSDEIETLFNDIQSAAQTSKLPVGYDRKIIDDFIENLYRNIIIKDMYN